ncbi:hypothetical protein GPK34_00835 [Secundilactobacillus kimchicus]|uniref:hypothetical protein n=1 Tax=Secundilactobacillus kimchicus TaxID=528209 RepID=UPI001C01DFF5|nr:hypothetical protein [Secundilactobacillus kimchicus]MBT9670584.1 hypothetical protein [Secundilactobacillus kimchicus]
MKDSGQTVKHWHSVVDFVKSAKDIYHLDSGQDSGFIEYMRAQGLFNMKNERDFVPYLKKFLGK